MAFSWFSVTRGHRSFFKCVMLGYFILIQLDVFETPSLTGKRKSLAIDYYLSVNYTPPSEIQSVAGPVP